MKKLIVLLFILTASARVHAALTELDNFLIQADITADRLIRSYNQHTEMNPRLSFEKLDSLLCRDVRNLALADVDEIQQGLGQFFQSRLDASTLEEELNEVTRTTPVKRETDQWVRSLLRQRSRQEIDGLKIHLFTRMLAEEWNRPGIWMILESLADHNSEVQSQNLRSYSHNIMVGTQIAGIALLGRAMLFRSSPNVRTAFANLSRLYPRLTARAQARHQQLTVIPVARRNSTALVVRGTTRSIIPNGGRSLLNVPNTLSNSYMRRWGRLDFRGKLRAMARALKYPAIALGAGSVYGVTVAQLRRRAGGRPEGWLWWNVSYDVFPRNELDTIMAHAFALKQQCAINSFYEFSRRLQPNQVSNQDFIMWSNRLRQLISSYAFIRALAPGNYSKQRVPYTGQLADGSFSFTIQGRGANKQVSFRRTYDRNTDALDTFPCPGFTEDGPGHFAVSLSGALIELEQSIHRLMRLQLQTRLADVERGPLNQQERVAVIRSFVQTAMRLNDEELQALYDAVRNSQFKTMLRNAILAEPNHALMDI